MPRRKGGGTAMSNRVNVLLENTPETSKTPVSKPDEPIVTKLKPSTSTFPARLQWKMAHLRMPTTSTPKVDLYSKSRAVTKRDVDTAFGFDDSSEGANLEANYSTLISPIAHSSSPKWKANPLTQRNIECDLPKMKCPTGNISSKRRSHRIKQIASSTITLQDLEDSKQVTSKDKVSSTEESSITVITSIQPVKPITESKYSTDNEGERSTTSADFEPEQACVMTDTLKIPIPKKPATRSKKAQPEKLAVGPKEFRTRKPSSKIFLSEKLLTRSKIPLMETSLRSKISASETLTIRTEKSQPDPTKPVKSGLEEIKRPLGLSKISTKIDPKSLPEPVGVEAETRKSKRVRKVLNVEPHTHDKKSKVTRARTKKTSVEIETQRSEVDTQGREKRAKRPLLAQDSNEDVRVSPFSQLLARYNDDDNTDFEGDLHVDPKKIIRTYGSKKRLKASEDREINYGFIPSVTSTFTIEKTKKKAKPSKRKVKDKDDDLEEETKKWLEEKNKEFEDVLKVPLVIEESFSE